MLLEVDLVRIFFEINGFYVKSHAQGSLGLPKKAGDFSLLDISNSQTVETGNFGFQLFGGDIFKIQKAQILVRPHHLQKTNLKMLKNGSKLVALIKKDISSYGDMKPFSDESDFNVLITPGFPTESAHREDLESVLSKYGVHCVLSYRTIFENILKSTDLNRRYAKDSPLELIRLLKVYDLIKGPQLELF